MNKINIALTSGSNLEKPLISAFKGNASNYVVLDNELNGTMGLPIILVSKFDGSKLSKIEDQNEWGAVKEMLRNIIAGNQMDYITVGEKVIADDLFYSQLTLPIASFEALKNNYKPVSAENNLTPPTEATPVPPVSPVMPSASPAPAPAPSESVSPAPSPVMNTPMPSAPNEAPVSPIPNPAPQVTPAPGPDTHSASESVPTPVAPVPPVETPVQMPSATPSVAPTVEPIPTTSTAPRDFSVDKEAFLKACENMFDALVAKLNK